MSAPAGVPDSDALQQRVARIESLVEGLDALPDAAARARVEELIEAVLELHGASLARILDLLGQGGPAGEEVLTAMAEDELVSNTLLLHGLHPVPLRTRVEEALVRAQPFIRLHGSRVELAEVSGSGVRLRLDITGDLRGATPASLRTAIEKAVLEAAPDAAFVEIDGGALPSAPRAALRPLPMIATTPAPVMTR